MARECGTSKRTGDGRRRNRRSRCPPGNPRLSHNLANMDGIHALLCSLASLFAMCPAGRLGRGDGIRGPRPGLTTHWGGSQVNQLTLLTANNTTHC